jgi:non-homologous end joining protein Ku
VAPRAYWKGYLKLSLVSCPIALFPARRGSTSSPSKRGARDDGHHASLSVRSAQREGLFRRHPGREGAEGHVELATHIVDTKKAHFEPQKFEDQYGDAVKELLKKKQSGQKIEAPREREPAKVINLMDALRRSVETEGGSGEWRKPAQSARNHRAPKKKAGRSSARAKRVS